AGFFWERRFYVPQAMLQSPGLSAVAILTLSKRSVTMKNLKFGILLSTFALTLAACSSKPTEQPGADTSVAAPASSNAAPAETPRPAAPKMVTVPAGTALE